MPYKTWSKLFDPCRPAVVPGDFGSLGAWVLTAIAAEVETVLERVSSVGAAETNHFGVSLA